jgi:hypothetical protein
LLPLTSWNDRDSDPSSCIATACSPFHLHFLPRALCRPRPRPTFPLTLCFPLHTALLSFSLPPHPARPALRRAVSTALACMRLLLVLVLACDPETWSGRSPRIGRHRGSARLPQPAGPRPTRVEKAVKTKDYLRGRARGQGRGVSSRAATPARGPPAICLLFPKPSSFPFTCPSCRSAPPEAC